MLEYDFTLSYIICMSIGLFIGNLNYETTEETLKNHLKGFGPVIECSISLDRFTFKSKGFGRAEIPDREAAEKIIKTANGSMLDGRPIKIDFFST